MVVSRGILLPRSMPLILPLICFLGLLLSLGFQLFIASSGRPKTAPQRRKTRRRLARTHNKPGSRAEGFARWVSSWPVERRIEGKASLSPNWPADFVAFVSDTWPRDDQKLMLASKPDASLEGNPSKFGIADNCGAVCFTLISWIRSLATTTTAAAATSTSASHPVAASTSKRKKTTQKSKREAKRPRGKKDDDLSDDEADGRDDDGPNDHENAVPSEKHWACPFYAFDPKSNYNCLKKHDFKRLCDVKLHLTRDHRRERFWDCLRCWARWPRKSSNRKAHETHVQLGTCKGINGTEELSEAEVERIKAVRGGTDTSKWYTIWNICFEGHAPPASPFVEDGLDEPRELLGRNARSNVAVDQLLARPQRPSKDEIIDAIIRAPFVVCSRLRRPAPSSQVALRQQPQSQPATYMGNMDTVPEEQTGRPENQGINPLELSIATALATHEIMPGDISSTALGPDVVPMENDMLHINPSSTIQDRINLHAGSDMVPTYPSHPSVALQDPNMPQGLDVRLTDNNLPSTRAPENAVSAEFYPDSVFPGVHPVEEGLAILDWFPEVYGVDLSNPIRSDENNYDLGGDVDSPSQMFDPTS